MQEQKPLSRTKRVTQRYSADEIALIADFATNPYTSTELAELFPNRSTNAIKKAISDERRRQGVPRRGTSSNRSAPERHIMLDPDDPGYEDDWQRRNYAAVAAGSASLLAAMRLAA